MDGLSEVQPAARAQDAPPRADAPRKRWIRRRPPRAQASMHYYAFLSYSHDDNEDAEWLHEAIEEFRVPKALVGRLTENGVIPPRLTPVFRDRGELAAADDLGDEIEEALRASRFLIVLCSPAAVESRWIEAEISAYKRHRPDGCVLAAIIGGEPFASNIPGREAEECFPPALRQKYDRRGRPTGKPAEPIAADLREHGDGRKLGLLKIIAGMLGTGLDDLVQRDTRRRQRRTNLILAASLVGMIFTTGLSVTAIQARDAARDQRREAESLIGFMLGDLRQKLEPIGRLDALDAVGARALAYYEKQNKSELSDAALAQRSRALTLMGEIANTRGDLDGALRRYREALAGTEEAVRRAPDDPQRVFDHAQNVFWVGYIDYQRGNMDKAAAAFREYRRLADRMIALRPDKLDYQLERVSADTNLGTVLWDQRHYRAAADVYQQSLEPAETLVAKAPSNKAYQMQLASTLAWLADARESSGQLDEAMAHRHRQLALLSQLWLANEGDTSIKFQELTTRRALARLLASTGDLPQALDESRRASAVAEWLEKTEPANTEWTQWGATSNFERAALELAANRANEARANANSACAASSRLLARDRSVVAWATNMQFICLKTNARIALRTGVVLDAIALSQQGLAVARSIKDPIDREFAVASAEMTLGEGLTRSGHSAAARGAFERALGAWPKGVEERPVQLADHATLLRRLGRQAEASELAKRLDAIGYRHPDYRSNAI
jgi:eukaryotic-like serine/threonine-protein kinase